MTNAGPSSVSNPSKPLIIASFKYMCCAVLLPVCSLGRDQHQELYCLCTASPITCRALRSWLSVSAARTSAWKSPTAGQRQQQPQQQQQYKTAGLNHDVFTGTRTQHMAS